MRLSTKNGVFCLAMLLFLSVALQSPAVADSFLNGLLDVNPIPQPTFRSSSGGGYSRDGTTHGYVEYRFRIHNRTDRPRRVTLSFSEEHNNWRTSIVNASTTVTVEPNSQALATILQPPVPFTYSPRLKVDIDGRREEMNFSATAHGYETRYGYMSGLMMTRGAGLAQVLISNRITANQRELIERGTLKPEGEENGEKTGTGPVIHEYGGGRRTMTGGTMPAEPTHIVWQSETPTSQWSDQWLGYTRFDCVVVNDSDMTEMKPEVFRALRRYVEMGGMLVVLNAKNWKTPEQWISSGQNNGTTEYRALSGSVFLVADGTWTGTDDESAVGELRNRMTKVSAMWAGTMAMTGKTPQSFESSLPLGVSYQIPVRSLVVLVIFFTLLIGPVNLFVLGMLKRRVWLIWTIPLTSILASFTVLGVVVFSEGIKRPTSSKTVTILDQTRGEAYTSGIVGYYRTFSPPNGLLFSASTEVTPVLGETNGLALGLQTQGDQYLTQNWIRARIPAYFLLRKAASANQRISFEWGDKPTAMNGLGVRLKDLTVCNSDGKLYHAASLAPGEKVELKAIPGGQVAGEHGFGEQEDNASDAPKVKFEAQAFGSLLDWVSLPNPLPRQTYRVTVDNAPNPFLEPGIENMKSFTQKNTIFGIFGKE
ncbi:MAG: hypothetical protein FWC50_09775 [Planctomycetaceae bacterium]|nr:hypothetical protein [Planctomycetaceae bacterium]